VQLKFRHLAASIILLAPVIGRSAWQCPSILRVTCRAARDCASLLTVLFLPFPIYPFRPSTPRRRSRSKQQLLISMFKFSAQKLFSNSSFRTFRRNQRSFISEETNENNTDSSQDSANTSSLPSSLMDDKKQERRLPKFKPTLRVPWIRKGVSETKTEVTTLTEQSDKNINNIVEDNQENGVTSNHTTPFQKLKSKLRRKNSGNWTSHRNGRIGNVKSALRIFAAVGDGLAPLPGIKGAAGIALEIANVMEVCKLQSYQGRFVALSLESNESRSTIDRTEQ